ncbi:tyrosine-type recombinase/integrase [Cyanobium gracile]|uniref:tyrosine-type recombinase/integrase n=1 Tax=Cyanobium gracile TaxID=59930 RepID=UPI00155AD537|nr:site-specific integrase [Cyanobium gracile]
MAYRKHGSYVRRGRAGFQLQRGVPQDIQSAIGKSQWKEPGGKTLREAQARVPGFLHRTDQAIAIARGEAKLSTDEMIDAIPQRFDLADPGVVEALSSGIDVELGDRTMTMVQAERMRRILYREVAPREHRTAGELIDLASRLKRPAARTREGWQKALDRFLAFAGVAYPTSATTAQAVAFRTHLLETLAPSTVSVTLAYLAGLWSVLVEVEPSREHIFKGLTKRIRVKASASHLQRVREAEAIVPVDQWPTQPCEMMVIFRTLLLTGCRLGEACGLRGGDIKSDRILIRSHELRPLKTAASEREVPLHPELSPLLQPLGGKPGVIWPRQRNEATGRWGVNLAKPCRRITGVSPHGLRHRAVTKLREAGFNEAVIGRLLGHTPNTITGGYGSVPWDKLVEAVAVLR